MNHQEKKRIQQYVAKSFKKRKAILASNYCFGYTKKAIEDDVAHHGYSTILEKITTAVAAK